MALKKILRSYELQIIDLNIKKARSYERALQYSLLKILL